MRGGPGEPPDRLHLYDAQTGEELWRQDLSDPAGPWTHEDGTLYVSNDASTIMARAEETGRVYFFSGVVSHAPSAQSSHPAGSGQGTTGKGKTTGTGKTAGRACIVPNLKGTTLGPAKDDLARAACRLGHITRIQAGSAKSGLVVAQTPAPHKKL